MDSHCKVTSAPLSSLSLFPVQVRWCHNSVPLELHVISVFVCTRELVAASAEFARMIEPIVSLFTMLSQLSLGIWPKVEGTASREFELQAVWCS